MGRIENKIHIWDKEELSRVGWLLFTSKNGIDAFIASLRASLLDARSLSNCRIATIGDKTAA